MCQMTTANHTQDQYYFLLDNSENSCWKIGFHREKFGIPENLSLNKSDPGTLSQHPVPGSSGGDSFLS